MLMSQYDLSVRYMTLNDIMDVCLTIWCAIWHTVRMPERLRMIRERLRIDARAVTHRHEAPVPYARALTHGKQVANKWRESGRDFASLRYLRGMAKLSKLAKLPMFSPT